MKKHTDKPYEFADPIAVNSIMSINKINSEYGDTFVWLNDMLEMNMSQLSDITNLSISYKYKSKKDMVIHFLSLNKFVIHTWRDNYIHSSPFLMCFADEILKKADNLLVSIYHGYVIEHHPIETLHIEKYPSLWERYNYIKYLSCQSVEEDLLPKVIKRMETDRDASIGNKGECEIEAYKWYEKKYNNLIKDTYEYISDYENDKTVVSYLVIQLVKQADNYFLLWRDEDQMLWRLSRSEIIPHTPDYDHDHDIFISRAFRACEMDEPKSVDHTHELVDKILGKGNKNLPPVRAIIEKYRK
jgi:hypothetical protein